MKRDKIIIFVISFLIPVVICFILKYHICKIGYDMKLFNGVEITENLLGIWATLLGFIITAASILLTMGGKKYIKAFKESAHYGTVLYTYALSSLSLLGATVFGIVVTCLEIWNGLFFYLLIYFIISTILLLFLCVTFLFFMIFKAIK